MITGDDPLAVEPLGNTGLVSLGPPRVVVPSLDDLLVTLKAFIHDVLPDLSNENVVQGQQNSVAMPVGPTFVLIIPGGRSPLATTVRQYEPDEGLRDTARATRYDIAVNFYGPSSDDYSLIFAMLFRDLYGTDFMRDRSVQPLWCDDPRQMPLIDEASQYEQRWLIQAHLQANPTISTSQQFADRVVATIVEAD